MRAFLFAAAVTVLAALAYGLGVAGLFRLDARDLEVDAAVVALAVVLYALPFAAGAWSGTRRALRDLAVVPALLWGAGGALAVLAVLTLLQIGGTDLLSVLVPLAGIAAGAALALRSRPS